MTGPGMSAELPPKQLSMVISALRAEEIPESTVPDGYELRGYLPGDEDSWLELLNMGEYGSDWDRSRLDEFIAGPERTEGSVVAARGDRIVAATFASAEVGAWTARAVWTLSPVIRTCADWVSGALLAPGSSNTLSTGGTLT